LKAAAAWSTTGAVATASAAARLLSDERQPVDSRSEEKKIAAAIRVSREVRRCGSGPDILAGRGFGLGFIPAWETGSGGLSRQNA
jgi:hypothetical protein